MYFEACDLFLKELTDRFDQQELLPPILELESLLIKAANGEAYGDVLHNVEQSYYTPDLDVTVLSKKTTSTTCDFFRSTQIAEAFILFQSHLPLLKGTEMTAYLLTINNDRKETQ